jgi:type II secretory pathway pseudopilin PulG
VVTGRGYILLEVTTALLVFVLLSVGAVAVLQGQAEAARALYEERVAWEAAMGQIALVEASGARPRAEGRSDLDVSSAGWENLAEGKAVLTLAREEDGVWRAAVEVSWAGFRGGRRRVEAWTLVRAEP